MVLFAGRLEYEKGVQTVLHALERVQDEAGPVVFYVAGVGTYSDELHRMVDELDLADVVRFTGFLEDHELRLHYAAADVAVAPSIYEPFGLVAVEAMACGTPVVVGDTGGLREIVSDGHGLSFPPQDADELADRLVAVLDGRRAGRGPGRQGPAPHRPALRLADRRAAHDPRVRTGHPRGGSAGRTRASPRPARPAACRPDPRARRRRQLTSPARQVPGPVHVGRTGVSTGTSVTRELVQQVPRPDGPR